MESLTIVAGLKDEEVYLKDYLGVQDTIGNVGDYFVFYNGERPHQSLGNRTPEAKMTLLRTSAKNTDSHKQLEKSLAKNARICGAAYPSLCKPAGNRGGRGPGARPI